MSLLNLESPNLLAILTHLDIEVLWHPSWSGKTPNQHTELLDAIRSEKQSLDFLCVEGAVIRGPGGTGMFDTFGGQPKKNLVMELAERAQVVIAVGTCASFGGITASGKVEATGFTIFKRETRGISGKKFYGAKWIASD